MKLIQKIKEETVRHLEAYEAAAIRRYCGYGQQVEAGDEAIVARIIDEMREDSKPRYWLVCDCLDLATEGQHLPVMSTRHRRGQTPHFFRKNDIQHQCALRQFRVDPTETEEESPLSAFHQPIRPIQDSLDYLEDVRSEKKDVSSGGRCDGSRSGRSKPVPKLGRILYTILEDAGFAQFEPAALPEGPWWEKVKRFAISEALNETTTLDDILLTTPWSKAEQIMRKIEALVWPKDKKKMGFVLFLADSVSSHSAVKNIGSNTVAIQTVKPIRIGGWAQDFMDPPYWVLIIVDRGSDGKARYREGFAMHAYNAELPIPLDSQGERHTLAAIIDAGRWLETKKGVETSVYKPLFDLQVDTSGQCVEWCRPDFEVEFVETATGPHPGQLRRVVIETMGSETKEYVEQKTKTHQRMELRGVLCKHVVKKDENQLSRNEAFRRAIMGIILKEAGYPPKA